MKDIKIEQVAIYSENPDKLIEALSELGFDEWQEDHVVAKGEVFGEPVVSEATLNFNYQIGPFEFEILKYDAGDNWIERHKQKSGMSHLGLHVDDVEPYIEKMAKLGYGIAQQVETQSHSNPNIKGKRKYKYVIFDTREAIGFDLKVIQRIMLDV